MNRGMTEAGAAIPVIVNASAGSGPDAGSTEAITRHFAAAGATARVLAARRGAELPQLAHQALAEQPPIIVAGGGDGTVNCVAAALVGTETALGVLPLGTLNHFAKDAGIPLELPEAVRTIVAGHVRRVDVGEVNGAIFLNNSSLGLYPHMVREREILRRRLGTAKWAAAAWATLTALHRGPLLDVRLRHADADRHDRTPLVFIGNNEYVVEGFDLGGRERLDAGVLSLYVSRRRSRWALLGLALRALVGRLRQADDFDATTAQSIVVESRRQQLPVATDGEVRQTDTPLRYRIRAGALRVVVPAPDAAE